MNKIIWLIIVVALIVGGYFWWQSARTPVAEEGTPSQEMSVPTGTDSEVAPAVSEETVSDEAAMVEQVEVAYTDSGFSPKEVNVKVGETVIFKNESNRPLWVASNPHPTHTDYPEFDARSGYAPGDSYQFTFTRVGVWKYHNHLTPEDSGTVVVSEK